jgi:hypothetical protein
MTTITVRKKTTKQECRKGIPLPEKKKTSVRSSMFGYYKDRITFAEGDIFNLGL